MLAFALSSRLCSLWSHGLFTSTQFVECCRSAVILRMLVVLLLLLMTFGVGNRPILFLSLEALAFKP